ncbi:MAG: HNH endonuclease [Chloroflexi bacterium GWB2_49_20]|nr:MAG: HNH endonuclease [Chloroflexi bacterium GWB2_49_20]OGN78241.1 MAG: HNH endonuclease [Chloroflexi bacterium GWC2_49_37]OGN85277.1 MAG: HNH endonuclease [Chloroflexi bacterium GWD2_49_16]
MQKAPVLVLNANFEPINICNIKRAIGLILSGKAAMVANGRGYIHTISKLIPEPSIIRLEYMVHRPRPHIRLTRREVFRRDNFTCQYCGQHTTNLTIDHVQPKHLGGEHIWTNVVAACPFCNHRKGGRRLTESQLKLIRQPIEPPSNANYLYGSQLYENNEWKPFLIGW